MNLTTKEEPEASDENLAKTQINKNLGVKLSLSDQKNNNSEQKVSLQTNAIIEEYSTVKSDPVTAENSADKLIPNDSHQNGNHSLSNTIKKDKINELASETWNKLATNCNEAVNNFGNSLEKRSKSPIQVDRPSDSFINSNVPDSLQNMDDSVKDIIEYLIKETVRNSSVQKSENFVLMLKNNANKENCLIVQGQNSAKIARQRKSKHHECCENHIRSTPVATVAPNVVSNTTPRKRRANKKSYENEPINPQWLEPFKFDWKRELVMRSNNSNSEHQLSDVYYFSPEGQKLRSYREIDTFLSKNSIANLTIENFTFQKRQIYEYPHDVVRDAVIRGKGIFKTPSVKSPPPSKTTIVQKPKLKRKLSFNTTPTHVKIKFPKGQIVPPLKITCVETSDKKKRKLNKMWQVQSPSENPVQSPLSVSNSTKRKTVKFSLDCLKTNGGKKIRTNSDVIDKNPFSQQSCGDEVNGSTNVRHLTPKPTPTFTANSTISTDTLETLSHDCLPANRDDEIEEGIPSCSLNCPFLSGIMPTLQCINCLCFYHPSCAKVKEGELQDSFICVNCKIRKNQPVTPSSKDSSPCPIIPELVINAESESPTNKNVTGSIGESALLKIMRTALTKSLSKQSNCNSRKKCERRVKEQPVIPEVVINAETENPSCSGESRLLNNVKNLPVNISKQSNHKFPGPPPLKRAPLTGDIPDNSLNSPRYPPPLQRKPSSTTSSPPKRILPKQMMANTPVIHYPPPLRRGTLVSNRTVTAAPIVNTSASITGRLLQYSRPPPPPNAVVIPTSQFPIPLQRETLLVRNVVPHQLFASTVNRERVITAPIVTIPSPSTSVTSIKKLTEKLTSAQLALSTQTAEVPELSSAVRTPRDLNNRDNNQQDNQVRKLNSLSKERALQRSNWLNQKANSSHNFFHKLQSEYKCLMNVFKHLNTVDLVKASSVCKLWRDAILQDELWKTVKLKGINVTDWEKLVKIMQKKGTRKLDMTEMQTFEDSNRTWHEFVDVLQEIKMTKIEEINFGFVSVSVLHAVLESLTNIKVLTAESLNVTNSKCGISCCRLRLTSIEKLKNLRKLRLRAVHGIQLLNQNHSNLNELGRLQHLEHLSLTSLKDVSSSELMFLKELTTLTTLELGSCINWTAEVYRQLLNLKNLSRLRLECGSDNEDSLATVLKNSKIQVLELIDFKIDRDLMKHISSMSNLEGLSLKPDDSIEPKIMNSVIMENIKHLNCLKVFKWEVKVVDVRETLEKKNTKDDDDIIVLAETILVESKFSGNDECKDSSRINNIPFLLSTVNSSVEFTNIEQLTSSILKLLSRKYRNSKVLLYSSDESRDLNKLDFISNDEIQEVQNI